MTQRLIDADALERAMYEEAFEKDSDMQRWDSGCWIRYKLYERVLDAQPIIDAEPVTHGRWLKSMESDDKGASCSVCKITFGISDFELLENFQYCPCCGARMDEHD